MSELERSRSVLRERWRRLAQVGALSALAFVGIELAAPGPCQASLCRNPKFPFFWPAGGALPPNPVIYLFSLEVEPTVITDPGVTARVVPLASASEYHVYRVELRHASPPPRSIQVRLPATRRGVIFARAKFELSATAPRPTRGLTQIIRSVPYSTCSSWLGRTLKQHCFGTRGHYLHLNIPAAAHRVEWATTPEAYRLGQVKRTIVKGEGPFTPINLEERQVDGSAIKWGRDPIYVGVVPLFTDGSEGPRPREPARLDPPPEWPPGCKPRSWYPFVAEFRLCQTTAEITEAFITFDTGIESDTLEVDPHRYLDVRQPAAGVVCDEVKHGKRLRRFFYRCRTRVDAGPWYIGLFRSYNVFASRIALHLDPKQMKRMPGRKLCRIYRAPKEMWLRSPLYHRSALNQRK